MQLKAELFVLHPLWQAIESSECLFQRLFLGLVDVELRLEQLFHGETPGRGAPFPGLRTG